MTQFQTSRHLRRVATRESGHEFCFHSLFGKGRLVDQEITSVLNKLEKSTSLNEVLELIPDETFQSLQELAYIVPTSLNERELIDASLQDRSKRIETGEYFSSLQLVLVNSCNFSCSYCFAFNFDEHVAARNNAGENIATDVPSVNQKKSSRIMSLDIAISTVHSAIAARRAVGGANLSISLFGGEPTLNRKVILGLLHAFGTKFEGVDIEWDITTNGSRLDDELIEAFALHRANVTVSVDFLDKETLAYRVDGATESWDVIARNIKALVARNVNIHVSSVLSTETWARWDHQLIDWLAESGISRLNVIVAFQGTLFDEIAPERVAERLHQAFLYGQSQGVLLTGYWYITYLMIVNDARYAAQADFKTCPATGRMISIEPNGSAFTCKATSDQVGDASNFEAIFKSSEYRKYAMRAYQNSPDCKGCELEGTCSGGSMGSLEESFGDIEKMDNRYCNYMRSLIPKMLGTHVDTMLDSVLE